MSQTGTTTKTHILTLSADIAAMSGPKKSSYLAFAGIVALTALLHLGPVLLAGLFSYMVIDFAHKRLALRVRRRYARIASLILFVIVAGLVAWLFGYFIKQGLVALPGITAAAIPRIGAFTESYGIEFPFENAYELRELLVTKVKQNALGVTKATGLLTKGFFQVLVGIFVAILCFLSQDEREPEFQPNLFDALRREFRERMKTFIVGFEKVLGAQVTISAINTVATTLFLVTVGIPYLAFLVPATFILGILPVIGNILSNTLIFGAALTMSERHAVFALAFLVIIHKAEYFLNSRIVGSSIDSPMWLTLIGILVGEMVMGVPGIILAPALFHYVRAELQAIPAR